MKKQVILVTITMLIVILTGSCQIVAVKGADEEVSIQSATSSINLAFTNVLAAEKAGGNVTALLARLDGAGDLLADAQNAYQAGNPSSVVSKADNARQIADQVNTEALTLKDFSLMLGRNSFWFTVIFSVVCSIVFILIMIIAWQRFSGSYTKKLLSMKPEVVYNET